MVTHYATIREAQGHHREVLSGGSVVQSDEPTNISLSEMINVEPPDADPYVR